MSDVYGVVRLPDGRLRYTVYDGSGDTLQAQTFATPEAVRESWWDDARQAGIGCHCTPPTPVPVDCLSTYGAGFSWPGRCCTTCWCLTQGHAPFDAGCATVDGLPAWAPWPDIDTAQAQWQQHLSGLLPC